ncbi:MAG: acyltransferase family protein, partial [Bacteroidales bacterium]|nr:acyltransferase family protein [Bacteroidales bacterium]
KIKLTKNMNTITEKKRLVYLDLIRVIATFCVIIVHVFATDFYVNIGSYNWFISALGCNLFRWASPLFVMISGVIFLQPTKEVSYSILLKKTYSKTTIGICFLEFSLHFV